MTPNKVCLGVVSVKQWYREKLQNLSNAERKKKNYATPIEEKESYRWLENYKHANKLAQEHEDNIIVSIADREGDIYDIYEEAQNNITNKKNNSHYIIRAKTDRNTVDKHGKRTNQKIKSMLKNKEELGIFQLNVSKTKKRNSRKALIYVYADTVIIALPDKRKKKDNYTPVKVTAILAVEKNPPKEEEPIEWLLITSLTANDYKEAYEKIEWYSCRWQIEIYFKILKSGCKIEKLQLKDQNFSSCLRFYMIIAWRILYVTMLGRYIPDMSCEYVFSREEWETTQIVLYRKKPTKTPPTLKEMVRMVASLGGYMNRKSDPEPGIQTIWIGMRNMQEHLKTREAFFAVYGKTYG